MASDQARYNQVLRSWQSHIDNDHLSTTPTDGSVAIMVPYLHCQETNRAETERLPALEVEAYSLADKLRAQGRKSITAVSAVPEDFKRVLTDPSISDIILVGHGCLSSVEAHNPSGYNRLDWEDMAKMADHLKRGEFVQRVCGTLPRSLNVPIGLMVVDDHRKVRASVGHRLTSEDLAQNSGTSLASVTDLGRMEYRDIKREFPQRKLSIKSRTHVVLGAVKQNVLDKRPTHFTSPRVKSRDLAPRLTRT